MYNHRRDGMLTTLNFALVLANVVSLTIIWLYGWPRVKRLDKLIEENKRAIRTHEQEAKLYRLARYQWEAKLK